MEASGPCWGSDTQMAGVLTEHSAWTASSEPRPQEPGCQPAPLRWLLLPPDLSCHNPPRCFPMCSAETVPSQQLNLTLFSHRKQAERPLSKDHFKE